MPEDAERHRSALELDPSRLKLEPSPGLIDLLSSETPPSREELTVALGRFLDSDGVRDSPLAEELRSTIEPRGIPGVYMMKARDLLGVWKDVRNFFAYQTEVSLGTQTKDVELGEYWLTLPSVQGSKVTMKKTTASSQGTAMSITIFAVDGGHTQTVTLSEVLSFSDRVPARVYIRAPATFEKIQFKQGDRVWGEYLRLSDIDQTHVTYEQLPTPQPDPSDWGKPKDVREFDQTATDGTATREIAVASGTELTAGVKVEALGLKASLETKAKFDQEIAFENELPGRHHYVAELWEGRPAWLWRVTG